VIPDSLFKVGTGPFRGLDAPFALNANLTLLCGRVNYGKVGHSVCLL